LKLENNKLYAQTRMTDKNYCTHFDGIAGKKKDALKILEKFSLQQDNAALSAEPTTLKSVLQPGQTHQIIMLL
jgi:hypothetical protein